jgi:hypothetical protein
VYNSRNVESMPQTQRDLIQSVGFPLQSYFTGKVILGPVNKSSITKFANMNTLITKYELPFPPSQFIEMVVDRTTGNSRQDFREIIDGKPGAGKSYSAIYGCARYAIEAADRHGQNPKDYFSLDNCALLQDTEGVTRLMDDLDKYQAVLIDDAGVSVGNKDFLSQSNKNLGAIMQTCRTKRWYVMFTAPMNKHLDLQIRELTYCRGNIYKSCHDANFNIIQQKGVHIQYRSSKYKEYNPHFIFDDVKTDLYAYFNPELLAPYKNIIRDYDKARDAAADSLIHERATQEKDAKNPVDKRDKKNKDIIEKYKDTVYTMTHDENGKWLDRRVLGKTLQVGTYSIGKIMAETGLNDRQVNKVIAHLKETEKK